jgi:O-antigen ligase
MIFSQVTRANILILKGASLAINAGLVCIFFGVATSRALVNVGLALVIVGLAMEGNYIKLLHRILSYRIFLPILLVFLLVVLGQAWGGGSSKVIELHLRLYVKLVPFIFVFAALNSALRIRCAWLAFFAGCGLMVSALYYRFFALQLGFSDSPSGYSSNYAVLRNYAVQSLITVFCCLTLAIAWNSTRNWNARALIATTFGACLASLLFLLESKTGLVALLLISLLFVFTRGLRVGVFATLAAVGMVMMAFALSQSLSAEWQSLASDLTALASGQQYNRHSSDGYRLAMWSAAIQLMAQSLWFGHGTGSYAALAPQFFNATECAVACVHPHNQWLFFGVEYGLVGVAVISFLVYRMAMLGWLATGYLRQLVWGLTLLFIVDASFNAPLWLPGERVFFFSMFALLAAEIRLTSLTTRDQLP